VHLVGFFYKNTLQDFSFKNFKTYYYYTERIEKNDHNLNRNTLIACREVNLESPKQQIQMLATKLKKSW